MPPVGEGGGGIARVMFLCTGNSCRSQMAEGFLRALSEGKTEARSAGISPGGLNPLAVQVMKEAGVDISAQRSKAIETALLDDMDYVITLCGNSDETCPQVPPQVKRMHWPVEDPAGATGADEEILRAFTKARDDIKRRVMEFIKKSL